jgi:hypothetical protein
MKKIDKYTPSYARAENVEKKKMGRDCLGDSGLR